MGESLVRLGDNRPLSTPPMIARAGAKAGRRFFEFFTANIRNKNTRYAYARAARDFFAWCEARGLEDIRALQPMHVAAYIEILQDTKSAPTVKQHLAAIRMLFDWLVVGQVVATNPASVVRGPKHVVKKGKTTVLAPEETIALFESFDTRTVVGLRDRALLGVLTYSFARISAALAMRVEDYFPQGKRWWVRLHEKGGKVHEMPAHHILEAYLDDYIDAAEIRDDKKGYLFRSARGKTGQLNDTPLLRANAYHMVRRRVRDAGIQTAAGCHTFRGTGITAYLNNDGSLEYAQQMAAHESPRTTKLYDRTSDEISLDEIEKIVFGRLKLSRLYPLKEWITFYKLFGAIGAIYLSVVVWWYRHNQRIFFPPANSTDDERERYENDLKERYDWIANERFAAIYRDLLGNLLDWVASTRLANDAHLLKENNPPPQSSIGRWFGLNPFTEGSYRLCLRLAFLYPIASFCLAWFLGGSGDLFGFTVFPDNLSPGLNLLLLGGIAMWLAIKKMSVLNIAFVFTFSIAVFAALGFAGVVVFLAFSGVSADAVAYPVAVIFALALVLAFLDVGVGAVASASAIALTVTPGVFWLHKQISSPRTKLAYWIGLGVFYITATVMLFAWSLSRSDYTEGLIVGMFLVILPLANSLLDWLSLGVTRGLLYAIHRQHHTAYLALGWVLLDIGLALLFLFGIATLTVGLLAGINAVTIAWADKPVTDLVGLFNELAATPLSWDYAWIHFMMLSTLIPTLFHFTIAGAAVVLAVPNPVRRFIIENWDNRNDARRAELWYVTLVPALGIAFPGLALWGLYEGLGGVTK